MKHAATTLKAMLTGATFMLVFGTSSFAWAKELVIQNDLNVDLYFTQVLNRQNFEIKSSPPDIVKAGEIGSFNGGVGSGSRYYKPVHLKVEYAVGWSGSSDKVNFGLKLKSTQTSFHCFTNSSTELIAGKVSGCNHATTTYRFYYPDE